MHQLSSTLLNCVQTAAEMDCWESLQPTCSTWKS